MRAFLNAAALFTCAAAAQAIPAELLGREWTVIREHNGVDPPDQRATIAFNEQGASGRTPCNYWEAHFAGSASAMRFTDFRVTERACPAPLDRIERDFLAGLHRMNSIRSDGAAIVLIDGGGAEIMRLAP